MVLIQRPPTPYWVPSSREKMWHTVTVAVFDAQKYMHIVPWESVKFLFPTTLRHLNLILNYSLFNWSITWDLYSGRPLMLTKRLPLLFLIFIHNVLRRKKNTDFKSFSSFCSNQIITSSLSMKSNSFSESITELKIKCVTPKLNPASCTISWPLRLTFSMVYTVLLL